MRTRLDEQTHVIFEFDRFRLDVKERLLAREGAPVQVTPKVFDTLLLLVENHGRLVDKTELLNRLWPDSFVEEGALTRNISDLRKALGESRNGQKFIETVPKHGYRFIAEVKMVERQEAPPVEPDSAFAEPAATLPAPATLPETSPAPADQPFRPGWNFRRPALPALMAAGLLVCALTLGIYYAQSVRRNKTPEHVTQIKSLAVLPFKPLNATANNEYLELGLADTLIGRLGSFERLLVRPTSAIRRYAGAAPDSLAAGRELQVEAVLDGSIQRLDERVRVTVQLLRVSDGRQLWAYQCEELCTNLFTVQDAISENVAAALALQLTGAERQRLTKHYTGNTEAYQHYVRGRWFWNRRTADDFQKAAASFEQALQLDPQYALAWAGLADCWLLLGGYVFVEQREAIAKARAAAEKALALDPQLAEAHATLGMIAQNHDRDWPQAEKAYQRALELNPNYATAHAWYGEMIAWLGRPEEGFARLQRALNLDPTSLVFNKDAAVILYLARKYDQAHDQLKKTLELEANFPETHFWLATVYTQQRRYEEAIAEYQRIGGQQQDIRVMSGIGHVYALMGRHAEARRILKQLQALSRRKYVQPSRFAFIHLALGEKDQALAWLEKEYAERGVGLMGLRTEPVWDPLRADPRFADLLRRMQLN